jgi:hypothetical protein
MTKERFIVVEGSETAHCCFDATVVDTAKPQIVNGKQYRESDGRLAYEQICECLDRADAEMIAAAMNAKYPPS